MMIGLQIKEAFLNLVTSKLRSFLALLGILMGTASVVAMVSGGRLATQEALKQIQVLGTNLLSVSMYGGASDESSQKAGSQGKPVYISLADIQSLSRKIPAVNKTGPYTQVFLPMDYNGQTINGSIIGVTQGLQDIIRLKMLSGRFISDLDSSQYQCVIGNSIYNDIMQKNYSQVLGSQLHMGNVFCTVVGVLKPWPANSFMYTDVNNSVLIPLQASLFLSNYVNIDNIVFRVDKEADFNDLQTQIQNYLTTHTHNLHFYFRSPEQLLATAKKQSDTLTVFLGFIGGISLLVGGIGVMNIMLVSVVERKREIGIRMAVGASRLDIEALFLIESVVLSFLGGVFGVVLGVLASYIIALYKGWAFTLYIMPPVLGFTVSVFIGIFFGFYPAHKASQLNPIDALRSD